MLKFIIPTYNRPEQLRKCVASIAEQIQPGMAVSIHIVENAVEENVRDVCRELVTLYPFVTVEHREHGDYSDAFRAMFFAAHEAEWAWTFGDDDILRPGALAFILPRLADEKADFIHVTELRRASGVNNIYHAATLLSLCNEFGWLDMTGFISCNITRGFLLAEAANTPRWKVYSRSAYVQSCVLLEGFGDRPAMFLDIPLVDSQYMDTTEETAKTWSEQNIPGRYLFVIDAIEAMYDDGILTKKVKAKFFRYLSYHLWDRFITHLISDCLNYNVLWTDEPWSRIVRFAHVLEDAEYAKQIVVDVEAGRGMCTLALYLSKNLTGLRTELTALHDRHNTVVYPYSYAPKATEMPSTAPEPTPAGL